MKKFALLLTTSLFALNVTSQDITWVGHRGASYLAPENTLASLQLAWELGAPAAECDIMLTADKQVILFHDKNGKRLTGHDFDVKQVDYKDIRSYEIFLRETNLEKYSGETIPLLADVLDVLPEDKMLVIEIKTGPEILPFMQKVIESHWKRGEIAFIAFDLETILQTKARYPEIPCYYLSAFRSNLRKNHSVISESNLDGVNLRHGIINRKLVKKYNNMGMDVWCWTVNDPGDAKKVIEAGVSAITTDRPAWLKEQMR